MAPIDIRSSSSIPMHAPDDKMRQVDIPFDDSSPGDVPYVLLLEVFCYAANISGAASPVQ